MSSFPLTFIFFKIVKATNNHRYHRFEVIVLGAAGGAFGVAKGVVVGSVAGLAPALATCLGSRKSKKIQAKYGMQRTIYCQICQICEFSLKLY